MGSCYVEYVLAIADDKEPDWEILVFKTTVEDYCRDYLGMGEEEIEENWRDHNADIFSAIGALKEAWDTECNCSKIHFPQFHCVILCSGGDSYGESPNDVFEAISILDNAGLLNHIGFEY